MPTDIFELLRTRRSVKAFRPDPIPRETIERLLDAAVWAPNHKLTEPWRFYVMGPETKARYAEIRRRVREERLPDPASPAARATLDATVRETLETPALLAVSCAVSDDPVRRDEDYAATAMAVQNLLLAAWSLGIGTYLRTGPAVERAETRALLGVPDDHRIFGIVSLGFPAELPTKRRTPAEEKTVWLP